MRGLEYLRTLMLYNSLVLDEQITEPKTKITSTTNTTEDEKKKKKGLKKFNMGNDIWIWAINEKTAIKKYKKHIKNEKHESI